jgi:hypothetical protein
MKHTCALIIITVTLLAGCATYRDAPPESVLLSEITVVPFVEQLSETNATIIWETAEEVYGWLVLIGPGTRRVVRTDTPGRVHRITFDGLEPGVAYSYRVAGQHVEYGRFRTMSPEAEQYRFAATGDSRSNPQEFARVADAITRHGVDFTIHSGDILARGTRHDLWYREWFTPGRDLLLYAPVFVAWGNHEQPEAPESYLHRYYPDRSQFTGQAYYTFRDGPVRYIMLNPYEAFQPGSAQYEWLTSVLAINDTPFTVVTVHVAPITGSAHTMDWSVREFRRWIVPLLVAHKVELVLCGHDHTYTRSMYGSTCFLICAGGGAPLYPPDRFMNPFATVATSCTHYVIFDVSPTLLRATTYSVDGDVVDEFQVAPNAAATAPAAGIAFQPPVRDYIADESFDWNVYVRNFTTNWLEGTVDVQAPAGWVVTPGTRQSFFTRRDENEVTVPIHAWTAGAAPGRYAVRTRVQAADAAEEMTCLMEVLAREPVKQVWHMDEMDQRVSWSDAPGARIADGVWRGAVTDDTKPELQFAGTPDARASSRDFCFWRMRLSGTNGTTRSRITLHSIQPDGHTNDVSTEIGVPVNDQWYTHVFAVGRELNWTGKPCGVTLIPASDPNVTIEVSEVRLATPPLPPVRE